MGNIGVDWWLALQISTKCSVIGFKEQYYNYLHHDGQISKNFKNRIIADRLIQKRFLKENPYLISIKTKWKAKFWSYVREGVYSRKAGLKQKAIISYIKAILVNPLYLGSYKAIVSIIIGI
jgi:hypothetical protein